LKITRKKNGRYLIDVSYDTLDTISEIMGYATALFSQSGSYEKHIKPIALPIRKAVQRDSRYKRESWEPRKL